MAVVSWPAGLPQNHRIGTTMAKPSSVIASENTVGPAVYQKLVQWEDDKWNVTTPVRFTGAQKATFDSFWDNINQGRDAFNWTRPDDDTEVEYRFRARGDVVEYPAFTLAVGDSDTDGRKWEAVLELEIIGAP